MPNNETETVFAELVPQTVEEAQSTLSTRDDLGRFVKGQSGNPVGRPVGSRNRATVMRELLDEVALGEVAKEYVQVVWAMIRRAKTGDVAAAKFVKEIADIASEAEQRAPSKTINVVIENFTIEEKK